MTAANALQVTAAALNLRQVLTGTFKSGTAAVSTTTTNNPATQWQLNQTEFALWDGNGIDRVAMGNLPAAGVSPAGFLFRAKDASGNPIFDSLGLIAAATLLTAGSTAFNLANITNTTWVAVSWSGGTAPSYTLTRQQTVLVMCSLTAHVVGTGFTGFGYMKIDPAGEGPSGSHVDTTTRAIYDTGQLLNNTAAQGYTNGMGWRVVTLPAGTYSPNILVQVDANVAIGIYHGQLDVFLMGG